MTILESGTAERTGNPYKARGPTGVNMGQQAGVGDSGSDRGAQGDTHMTSVWVQWGPGGVTFKLCMVLKSILDMVFRH